MAILVLHQPTLCLTTSSSWSLSWISSKYSSILLQLSLNFETKTNFLQLQSPSIKFSINLCTCKQSFKKKSELVFYQKDSKLTIRSAQDLNNSIKSFTLNESKLNKEFAELLEICLNPLRCSWIFFHNYRIIEFADLLNFVREIMISNFAKMCSIFKSKHFIINIHPHISTASSDDF